MADVLYAISAEGYSLYIAVAREANARAAERLLGGCEVVTRRWPWPSRRLSAAEIAACEELKKMDLSTYEYQSDFGRECVARGRRDLLLQQLTLRFGTLSAAQQARIGQASLTELESMGKRVITAATLRQA